MTSRTDPMSMLKATSRTFYIPISRLPEGLQEAVASAYLCLRAIDEIEDHPTLPNPVKAELLQGISLTLQATSESGVEDGFSPLFGPYRDILPEVTTHIGTWLQLAPKPIAPRIWDATAAMADRLAYWATVNWRIRTKADLDRYTFAVAGSVGLLLSDLWAWHDGTQTVRGYAMGFGRGLQSVNILRNRSEDLARGVDFFPDGWGVTQMNEYARYNLGLADAYIQGLTSGPTVEFCKIPLALAYATLDVLTLGRPKLSRSDVLELVKQVVSG